MCSFLFKVLVFRAGAWVLFVIHGAKRSAGLQNIAGCRFCCPPPAWCLLGCGVKPITSSRGSNYLRSQGTYPPLLTDSTLFLFLPSSHTLLPAGISPPELIVISSMLYPVYIHLSILLGATSSIKCHVHFLGEGELCWWCSIRLVSAQAKFNVHGWTRESKTIHLATVPSKKRKLRQDSVIREEHLK